jgi:hypothetical protein
MRTITAIALLVLLGSCDLSLANDSYIVRDLGLELEGTSTFTWCDNTRAVVSYQAKSDDQQAELILLDTGNPSNPQRFRFKHSAEMGGGPITAIFAMACQDKTVRFFTRKTKPSATTQTLDRQIYSIRLGAEVELVVALKEELTIGGVLPVNFTRKYVVGNGRLRNAEPPGSISKKCADHMHREYRLICWDTYGIRIWPLTKFVLAEYKWAESIPVLRADSTIAHIANPTKPMSNASGSAITYAVVLRDLDGEILAQLTDDKTLTAFENFVVNGDETFVYATCRSRSDPATRGINSVCRFKLDGAPHQWELVTAIDRGSESAIVLQMLSSVSVRGDTTFIARAGPKFGGIWRYDAVTRKVERVTRNYDDTNPKISGDGRSIIFVRRESGQSKLMLASGRGGFK